MSRVFKPKYRDQKTGKMREVKNWTIEYWQRGKMYREPTKSTSEAVAKKMLNRRLGEMGIGTFVGPQPEKVTFEDLAQMIEDDYAVNARKSTRRLKTSLKHLREAFALTMALDITTDRMSAYIRERLAENAARASVQKELACLRRMFTLAVRARKLATAPHIPGLEVRNTRKGFFEDWELDAVLEHLDDDLTPFVSFLALTGWRAGEAQGLTWRQVDFGAGVVRLEPGTTKNDEGREFPFAVLPELRELLMEQRKRLVVAEHVFHRKGHRIRRYHDAWRKACNDAGLDGRWIHDLRRTAVRNLERAGVSRSVAMKLTGHKTESIYRRYAITPASDLREGVEKLAEFKRTKRTNGTTVLQMKHGENQSKK